MIVKVFQLGVRGTLVTLPAAAAAQEAPRWRGVGPAV